MSEQCDFGGMNVIVMTSNDYRIINSQSQRIVRSEALKGASYPTSIVFKGLRKSRVDEESSIKD